jgi:hypothetical protein
VHTHFPNKLDYLVTINPKKTENIIFSCKLVKLLHPTLILNNELIKTVSHHDHLGVTLTQNLLWCPQVLKIHQKASKKLNITPTQQMSRN